ncbi:MAG: hypothetical protein EU550_04105 [Promethearchaeota archaeon]|nr:MAG: hypothetical protein EU550_04105 [Candidatus Lokiarchaeota archaeon]
MEFYGDNIDIVTHEKETEEDIVNYNFTILIRKVINILRSNLGKKGIVGGGIFSLSGKILYTSLPEEILLKITKEIEIRIEREVLDLKKVFYVFKDSKVMILDYLEVSGFEFIIGVNYSGDLDISSINATHRIIINDILLLEFEKDSFLADKGKYWLYSKVSYKSLRPGKNDIILDTHNIKVDKKVIKNLRQIKQICRHQSFEGKIYFDERFVELMQGLSYTLQDASTFMKNLNKLPD